MAAIRHLRIVLPPYETSHEVCFWPQLPVKFHVNLIHRSKDIAVWMFRIFGLKWLFRPQNGGFGVLWAPKCDYSSSRPPKGTSLRKSASFKLSTVKIRWRVWLVGELTESVTDMHTLTYTYQQYVVGKVHCGENVCVLVGVVGKIHTYVQMIYCGESDCGENPCVLVGVVGKIHTYVQMIHCGENPCVLVGVVGKIHTYVQMIHCGENVCVLVGRCGERTHIRTNDTLWGKCIVVKMCVS